jgi:3-oxoacyl-[acyl-carrier-protein] synthase II
MIALHRRVVITGIGIVSPLGDTQEQLWHGLSSGQSGVGPVTWVSPGVLPVPYAAEARSFHGGIDDFGPLEKEQMKAIRKGLKVMCRECQMGVAAAQLALADASLGIGRADPSRTGICFGSDYMISLPEEFTAGIIQCLNGGNRFDFSRWPTEGMPKMSPLWLLKYLPNMPASHLAIYNDFRGPNNSLTVREAAANMVVAEAFQTILRGSADAMLVGATGTRIHPLKAVHASQQEELAITCDDPAVASRPFDRDRSGMVLGEGAGAVVLEERSVAQARGAKIYGEVLGGASSAVAGRNLIARRDQAMVNVLCSTLRSTGMTPDSVGHVHAHGLSTRTADIEEARALDQVFGQRHKPIPVVAAKSHFGNLGAGSGMVELIASLLAFQHGRLFPTLNYRTPDPACPVSVVTEDATAPGESFVNLSVTPQGQASAVLIRQPD